MLGQPRARPKLARRGAVVGRQLVPELVRDRLDRGNRRRIGVGDPVRRRVALAVGVLEPDLERVEPELQRDPFRLEIGSVGILKCHWQKKKKNAECRILNAE